MTEEPKRDRGRPPNQRLSEGYQLATRIFAVTIIGFGIAIVAVTLARGGGPTAVGVIFGLLFTGIGVGRLYVSLKA